MRFGVDGVSAGLPTIGGVEITATNFIDTCDSGDDYGDVQINHAQDLALAGSSTGGTADPSDRLVDAYNIRFMGGQMSPFMRQTLISYLNTLSTANSGSDDFRIERIERALGLILTSPEYIIQK